MKSIRKILVLAAVANIFCLSEPIGAKTKDGAAALVLLAATGGLGYAAKKAYYKMQLAQTETEKGRAQRRFIFAVLGALAAGAGTAYTGHTYFNDSSEQQAPDAPGAQAVSAVPRASTMVAGSPEAAIRRRGRKRDDQTSRTGGRPVELQASVATPAMPDIAQAPAAPSPAQGDLPLNAAAAISENVGQAESPEINVPAPRVPSPVPVVPQTLDVPRGHAAQQEVAQAIVADTPVPPVPLAPVRAEPAAAAVARVLPAARDLAYECDSRTISIRHVFGRADCSVGADAARRMQATFRRDEFEPGQFCEVRDFFSGPPRQLYLFTGARPDPRYVRVPGRPAREVNYLYVFDENGEQQDAIGFYNQLLQDQGGGPTLREWGQVNPVVLTSYTNIHKGMPAINTLLNRAIEAAAMRVAPPLLQELDTLSVSINMGIEALHHTYPQGTLRINEGRITEESYEALRPFNLKNPRIQAGAAIPADLQHFPMVIRIDRAHGRRTLMLGVDDQRRCQWFELMEGNQVRAVSDAVGTRFNLSENRGTVKAPAIAFTEARLSVGEDRQVQLALEGAGVVRLAGDNLATDLYWHCIPFNWHGMPEVPQSIRNNIHRYFLVLRYERTDGPDLWIGLASSDRESVAIINEGQVPNTRLIELLQQPLTPCRVPENPAMQQAAFKRDMLHDLKDNNNQLDVLDHLLEDPRVTLEVLRDFSGPGVSIVDTIFDLWPDDVADVAGTIVEFLQANYAGYDWVNGSMGNRIAPLCRVVDREKPEMAQMLLGIYHLGKTPARPELRYDQTILHYAIYRAEPTFFAALFIPQEKEGRRKGPRLAVEALKRVINQPNGRGVTPLMLALQMQDFAYARVLIENGAALTTPQGQDIREYAARIATEEMFDALCSHERVTSELNGTVEWVPQNEPKGPGPAQCMQMLKSISGGFISAQYDADAGVMESDALRSLHRMNAAGTTTAQQPELQGYPLVCFIISYGKGYWMCADARGHVAMFNAQASADGAGRQVANYDGNCWGPHGTCLHIARPS